jgi:parallel beta-helix repeat protein
MSNSNTFMKNRAIGNQGGFGIQADGTMLISNTASNNGCGGIFISGNSNVVKGNMVSGNYVNVFCIGISVSGQMDTVSSNIVKNNQGDGIELSQLSSSTVSGNVVMNNDGNGIHVLNTSSGNTISGNTAMGKGQALGGFDIFDASVGMDTAGTANTWLKNEAQTRSPAGLL